MNVAYNVDCMEYMRTLQDKAFDLAVVDPPYGIGIDGQKLSINKNPKHTIADRIRSMTDTELAGMLYNFRNDYNTERFSGISTMPSSWKEIKKWLETPWEGKP